VIAVTVLFPFGDDPDGLEELFAGAEPFDVGTAPGTIVPHVTVGKGVPEDDERQIQAALPIRARAESVAWLEEQAEGRWGERRRFALGG
jgi:hypothetical protein